MYSFSDVVRESMIDLWSSVVAVLPDIVGAIVIVILGLLISPIFGGVVKRIIDVLKVDEIANKMGIMDALKGYFKKPSISVFFGKLVKWFFIIAFFMAATEVLNWNQVTEFLNQVILYIPNVLIAVVILVIGMLAGKFLEEVVVRSIKGSQTPLNHPEVLGKVTRYSLVIFAVLAALIQLGIAPSLIQILFAGIVLAMALAFGLGGREKAAKLLDYIDGTK